MHVFSKGRPVLPLLFAAIVMGCVHLLAQTSGFITVKGSVVNELGALQPGVRVIFSSSADPRKMVQYDIAASGTFSVMLLPATRYNLRIMAYVYPLQYYDPANPQSNVDGPPLAQSVFADGDSLTIHLTMAPRLIGGVYGIIKGTVMDSLAQPLYQAVVTMAIPGKDVVGQVTTDYLGNFVCKVPAQPQMISVSAPPYPLQFWGISGTTANADSQNIVFVLANDTTFENILVRNNPQGSAPVIPGPIPVAGSKISGTVQTSAGVIVAGVNVSLNGTMGNVGKMVMSDSLGKFTFEGVAQDTYCLNVVGGDYYMPNTSKNCGIAIVQGGTISGLVLQVEKGGFLAGNFISALMPDTQVNPGFEVALFPDTLPVNQSALWESMDIGVSANRTMSGAFTSSAIPPGKWRLVYRPSQTIQQQPITTGLVFASWGFNFGQQNISFLNSSPVTITAGDTVKGLVVNFGKGFYVSGRITFQGAAPSAWCQVTACIKDGKYLVPVARASVAANGLFTLPGLVDGRDYFIRLEGANYPLQYWAVSGPTSDPSATYHFSSAAVTPLNPVMSLKPAGLVTAYQQLSATASVDDTGALSVECTVPAGVSIDTLNLLSKDRYGTIVKLTSLYVFPGQTKFTWKENRPWSQSLFSYVFIGKGSGGTVRSNTTGNDLFATRVAPKDSILIHIYTDRYGVRASIKMDTAAMTMQDTTQLLRKTGSGAWMQVCKIWGKTTELWDNSWDKINDVNKIFMYKAEVAQGTTVSRVSHEVQFTATAEFFSHFGNSLNVGKNQTYTSIQKAVDAAKDYDNISIDSGTYKENIDLKGKILSINGNWKGGVPPIIDVDGGVGFIMEYPNSGSPDNISLHGLKIINGSVGIKTFANLDVSQCLFANIINSAVSAVTDSAAMAKAASNDPFVDLGIHQNIFQCTFIGNFSGNYALSAVSSNLIADTAFSMNQSGKATLNISVNNSIFANYGIALFPANVKGLANTLYVNNCDFWNTSTSPQSTQISVSGTMYTIDPQFIDTVNYFIPDGSTLRTMSTGNVAIGYDQQRFWSTGQIYLPPLPTVTGVRKTVTGPRQITIAWNKLPASENVDAYTVYRVLAYDSLFFINDSLQWEPKINKDSMLAIMDTFSTKDSVLIDSSVAPGVPYIYVVIATKFDGRRSDVKLSSVNPLSFYAITIEPALVASSPLSAVRNLAHYQEGFTIIGLQWKKPSAISLAKPTYGIYRFHGGSLVPLIGNDSASVRAFVQSFKSAQVMLDSFSTTDTFFIDKSAKLDTSYLYVVSTIDSAQYFADRPLAWVSAKIDPAQFKALQPMQVRANQWNMIGPWAQGSLSFAKPTSSVVFHWDDAKSEDKLMSSYTQSSEMKSGAGYWFKSDVDTIISVDSLMFRQLMADHDSVTITLVHNKSGWNQIASIFPFPVKPAWLQNGRFTAHEWSADSARYLTVAQLSPWKAYWIFSDKDTQIAVKATDVALNSANTAVLSKRLQQAAWELNVSYIGKGGDPDNFIGVVPLASSKTVRLVSPKPPQAFDYPQLYLMQTGAAASAQSATQKLAKLYKASSALPSQKLEWMVGISATQKPGVVRISGIESVPEKVYLFWVTKTEAVDLRANPQITIPVHSAPVYGYVVATLNPKDIALYTNRFELRKCYPNPFSRAATLEFTVPYAWNADGSKADGEMRSVSLSVYNLSGQRVLTVVSGALPVGEHRAVWNGKSETGKNVAAGVYFARLKSGDFAKTLKLMKVR